MALSDIQIVAAQINSVPPEIFVPTVAAAPVAPMSMFEKFGTETENPTYWVAFNSWYSLDTNTWSTDPQAIIDAPAPFRATVAAWLASIVAYEAALLAWQINYQVEKEVQWRKLITDAILLLP